MAAWVLAAGRVLTSHSRIALQGMHRCIARLCIHAPSTPGGSQPTGAAPHRVEDHHKDVDLITAADGGTASPKLAQPSASPTADPADARVPDGKKRVVVSTGTPTGMPSGAPGAADADAHKTEINAMMVRTRARHRTARMRACLRIHARTHVHAHLREGGRPATDGPDRGACSGGAGHRLR